MQIDFEPDWDYLLQKSCNFYERIPYINEKTCYSWKAYTDANTEQFLGLEPDTIIQIRKNQKTSGMMMNRSKMGIYNLVSTRFEWRYEYRGPRYFPVKSRACIEWNLREEKGYITDLTKGKLIKTTPSEESWYCVYTADSYEDLINFWEKTWFLKRTLDD